MMAPVNLVHHQFDRDVSLVFSEQRRDMVGAVLRRGVVFVQARITPRKTERPFRRAPSHRDRVGDQFGVRFVVIALDREMLEMA